MGLIKYTSSFLFFSFFKWKYFRYFHMIVPHHHQNVQLICRPPFGKKTKKKQTWHRVHPTMQVPTVRVKTTVQVQVWVTQHVISRSLDSVGSSIILGLEPVWRTPAAQEGTYLSKSSTSRSLYLLGPVTQSCVFVTWHLWSIMLHLVCIINKARSSQPTGFRIRAGA